MRYFVTEEFVKEKTHITQNVDAQSISPFFEMAMIAYVQPILGYTFLNDLLVKYNADDLNSDETTLVEFISYVVAFYAAYDAVPSLTFPVGNKGINSQSGDFSQSVGLDIVNYIRRDIYKFAKIREDALRMYLYENADKFELYESVDNQSIVEPDKQIKKNRGGITSI